MYILIQNADKLIPSNTHPKNPCHNISINITISLSLSHLYLSLLISLSTYCCPTVEHMTIMFGCLVVSSDVSKEVHALGVLTGTEDVPYLVVTYHFFGLSINELDPFIGNWQQNGGDFGNDVCWFLKMKINISQLIVNLIWKSQS